MEVPFFVGAASKTCFLFMQGNTEKDRIEFNIKSPDGKSMPPMPYSAQIEVS